jgi:phosphoribosylformylglycinamidine synthase
MDLCLSAEAPGLSRAGLLFGETPGRMLVVVAAPRRAEAEALCQKHQVPCHPLGIVRGDRLTVTLDGELALDEPVAELEQLWRMSLRL